MPADLAAAAAAPPLPPAPPVEDTGPAPGSTIRHIQVLDGLRGLAIVLVVLFHVWQMSFYSIRVPGIPGRYGDLTFIQFAGDFGVELFFFISAFCLAYPHARAMYGQGEVPTLRHFYYRRAIKIVPSYALTLLLCGLFFLGIYSVTQEGGIVPDLLLHATFLHNLDPDTRSSFDLVLWSLAVEVQFYVLFPLLARRFRRTPWVTAGALVAVALVWRQWVRDQGFADFFQWNNQLPSYLDIFGLGMLAAWAVVWIRARPAAVARLHGVFTVMAVAGFGALLAMFRWTYDVRYDGPPELWQSQNRTWFGVIFAFIAVGSVFAHGAWRRILANPVLLFLSTISYNLYLWHAVLGRAIKDRGWWPADTPTPTDDPHWRWTYTLVTIAASVAVATAITYGFERPLLRRGVRGVARTLQARLPGGAASSPGPGPERATTKQVTASEQATAGSRRRPATGSADARQAPDGPGPRRRWWTALGLAVGAFCAYRWSYQGEGRHFDYFVRVADALLHGRTNLLDHPAWLSELIPHDGKWYVVFPPMPAFVALPFVAVWGPDTSQPMVSMLVAAAAVGVAHLALSRLFRPAVALAATILYGVGTNLWYHAEVGSGWYFAQVCAQLFLWLALLEGVTHARPALIGLCLGGAFLCRVPTVFAVAFFLVFLYETFFRRLEEDAADAAGPAGAAPRGWREVLRWRPRVRPLALLAAGLAPAFAVAAWYNYTRFGSVTEFGYELIPGVLDEPWYAKGVVDLSYAPEHLKEIVWGLPAFQSSWPYVVPKISIMALWVTTPAVVLALLAPRRSRLTWAAVAAVVAILPLIVMHGFNGMSQFGNRFSLDYLPFLVLLMALGMRRLPGRWVWAAYALVALSVLANVWGVVMISRLGRGVF